MIRSLLFLFVFAAFGFQAQAAECRRIGSYCADTTASKYISGVWVAVETVGGCWQYNDTYECAEPNSVNYCGAIAATPGCNKTSEVCSTTVFNGTCQMYTETYRCGNSMTPPAGTVQLNNSYTITYDNVDTTPCASYSSNPSCQLSAKTCTEGPSTKNINGLDVYKDCWQWKEDYNCLVSDSKDFCMPLKTAGCTQTSETCTNTAFTGECIEKDFQYRCGDLSTPPAGTVLLNTTYTIVKDELNQSQCTPLDTNPNCILSSSVCTDGPSTKNISGLDVYKDCWNWAKTYACATPDQGDNCAELNGNPACTKTGSNCVPDTTLPGGQCGLTEHLYKCVTAPEKTNTITDCSGQKFCMNGRCFDTGYDPDADFGKAVGNMEAFREAANYSIFKGEADKCTNTLLAKCCKTKSGGEQGNNNYIANQLGAGVLRAGVESVKTWGSKYIFEGLMNSGSAVMKEMAWAGLSSGAIPTTGTFSVMGAEFSAGGGSISFVGFDPTSLVIAVAIFIVMEMMQCDDSEIPLMLKRQQNLCHKVGNYCASKVLGACVSKAEGWCCFPSVLARIVNVQGRAQLGKDFGDPKSPDCSGFTIQELERLRFDDMDLSEFIDQITARVTTNTYAVDRIQQRATSYYGQP